MRDYEMNEKKKTLIFPYCQCQVRATKNKWHNTCSNYKRNENNNNNKEWVSVISLTANLKDYYHQIEFEEILTSFKPVIATNDTTVLQ